MLRANAVDERYLTSYTAYRTSGGLAPGGGLRHAASGSEMCFCIHPRSASAHVRTPPISGAHFSPLYCTTGYHHNTQHTTHPTKPKHQQQKTQPQHKPPKPNQNTQQNTTQTKKDASPRRGKRERRGKGERRRRKRERRRREGERERRRGGRGGGESTQKKPAASPTGNRTPVTRVTGGYTDHYTIEEEAMSEQASQTE